MPMLGGECRQSAKWEDVPRFDLIPWKKWRMPCAGKVPVRTYKVAGGDTRENQNMSTIIKRRLLCCASGACSN